MPATGLNAGLPSVTTSSVASVATTTRGGAAPSVPSSSAAPAASFLCSAWAFAANSAMSAGGPPTVRHGPSGLAASYHHFFPPER